MDLRCQMDRRWTDPRWTHDPRWTRPQMDPCRGLNPGAGKTKTAYMWAYARGAFEPEREAITSAWATSRSVPPSPISRCVFRKMPWRSMYPDLARFSDRLEQRPSFKDTVP